jgi:hypothetical protein
MALNFRECPAADAASCRKDEYNDSCKHVSLPRQVHCPFGVKSQAEQHYGFGSTAVC